jgi:hypothetical protein
MRKETSSSGIQPKDIFGFQFNGLRILVLSVVVLLGDLYFVERSVGKYMGL